MSSQDIEGRRSPRLQHEVLVSLTSTGGVFSGWGTNLSNGGVFVNAPAVLPQSTPVDVLLQLPGQSECKLKGRVAWTRASGPGVDEPGIGIQFVDPDEETKARIEAMVVRLTTDLA
jgi:uncharacterized protein (TIGR02266 family)